MLDAPSKTHLATANSRRKDLYGSLRLAIENGHLTPGHRLPPTREMARIVGVSRLSVAQCYKEMLSTGHLETTHGQIRVSTGYGDGQLEREAATTTASSPSTYSYSPSIAPRYGDDSFESASLALGSRLRVEFPVTQWNQTVKKCSLELDCFAWGESVEPLGYRHLREVVCDFLVRHRALRCTPDQVIVCSSKQHALQLTARTLLDSRDIVAVENPGSVEAKQCFTSQGMRLFPVPCGEHGIDIEALESSQHHVKLVYTTPSHQLPTGSVMSVPKRTALLTWAEDHNAIIIEDDRDALFRMSAQPMPTLQSMDNGNTVIYHIDFKNLLFPLTNLSFLVIPEKLIGKFSLARRVLDQTCSIVECITLARFIEEGSLDLQLRYTSDMLRKRKQALACALKSNLRDLVTVQSESSASHLLVHFNDDYLSDNDYIECAREAKMEIVSTHPYYLNDARPREFLVPFACADTDEISRQIERFAGILASRESCAQSELSLAPVH